MEKPYVRFPQPLPALKPSCSITAAGARSGRGFYDPDASIAMRVCSTRRSEPLDDGWAARRFERALALRRGLFDKDTSAYRLFNGEGDGLPGLVCDRYDKAAVLAFDGQAARSFWHPEGIAAWLADSLGLETVYERFRDGGGSPAPRLYGPALNMPVHFREHGVRFTADLERGQKTGFYLDQRENRKRVGGFAPGKRVLNLFGYSGAFSVYAGLTGPSTSQPSMPPGPPWTPPAITGA